MLLVMEHDVVSRLSLSTGAVYDHAQPFDELALDTRQLSYRTYSFSTSSSPQKTTPTTSTTSNEHDDRKCYCPAPVRTSSKTQDQHDSI